jgi:hypothetical protein
MRRRTAFTRPEERAVFAPPDFARATAAVHHAMGVAACHQKFRRAEPQDHPHGHRPGDARRNRRSPCRAGPCAAGPSAPAAWRARPRPDRGRDRDPDGTACACARRPASGRAMRRDAARCCGRCRAGAWARGCAAGAAWLPVLCHEKSGVYHGGTANNPMSDPTPCPRQPATPLTCRPKRSARWPRRRSAGRRQGGGPADGTGRSRRAGARALRRLGEKGSGDRLLTRVAPSAASGRHRCPVPGRW